MKPSRVILAMALTLLSPSRVTLRVTMDAIECRVRQAPENQWLSFGILDQFDSTRQLDDRSPQLFRVPLPRHLSCETGDVLTAFCEVFFQGPKGQETDSAVQNLLCPNP